MVVSSVVPAVTKFPVVVMARLMRPLIGAFTSVCSISIAALWRTAFAASSTAWLCSHALSRLSAVPGRWRARRGAGSPGRIRVSPCRRRPRPGSRRLSRHEGASRRALVDREEDVAFLHERTGLEVHLGDVAGNARTQLHRLGRLDASGELFPFRRACGFRPHRG